MSRNFYLLSRDSSPTSWVSVPVLWCTLKTYYEEYGINKDQWVWSDPYLGRHETQEEILETLRLAPPSIVGFNIYVWNERFLDDLAEIIKTEFPNCLIVYGGFQHNVKYNKNFFKEKSWVDIVIPGDAYGEPVLKEILDQYPAIDYTTVPYIFYTNSDRERCLSPAVFEKRSFNWPPNIFKAQEKYILPKLLLEREADRTTVAFYHTSRGCPYKCIYCDWGGGTNTKSIKKPYTTVLDETEWLASVAQVNRIELSDANFGLYTIDIEIAKHFVDLKKKYGYPQCVEIEPAKNHLSRVLVIEEILLEADLMSHHRLTIQTLDIEVRRNIQRVNMPFDAQVKGLRYLQSKAVRPLPLYIEAIMGLPGDSYRALCDEIDVVHQHDIPPGWIHHYGWMLLPESPAYGPEMREQFKIKTVHKWVNQNPKLKEGFTVSNGDQLNLIGSLLNKTVETVVGTHSYTPDDWMHMYRLSNFTVAGHIVGINVYLIEYIIKEHNVRPSQVLSLLLEIVDNLESEKLKRLFALEKDTLAEWMYGSGAGEVDFDPEFPLLIPHHAYFAFIILLNSQEFYKEISLRLSQHYNDSKIVDLGQYLANAILDITYSGHREFSTKYDWLAYFSNSSSLVIGQYNYVITDTATTTDLMEYYSWSVAEALNPQVKIANTIKLL